MDKKQIFALAGLFLLMTACAVDAADKSICSYDSNIYLYDEGSLKSCTLKDRYDINGITCKDNVPIMFHENGNLKSCDLTENATIDDTKCKADSPVAFYPNGRLYQCVKLED
jgi:hypothetical protein